MPEFMVKVFPSSHSYRVVVSAPGVVLQAAQANEPIYKYKQSAINKTLIYKFNFLTVISSRNKLHLVSQC